jgi:hypothetical protein
MGIQDRKRRRFPFERIEAKKKHGVLQDIGVIAGVKGVAVVHQSELTSLQAIG